MDRFYVHITGHEIRTSLSFINLKSFNGEGFATYREDRFKCGLLEYGVQCDETMAEIATIRWPR